MKRLSIHAALSIYVLRTIALNAIDVSSVWHLLNPKMELNCHDSTDVMQWTVAAIWRRVTLLGARVGRNQDGAWQDLWPKEQTSATNRVQPQCIGKLEHMSSYLPQPQNNLASAGRITRQERVKTPVNTTWRMWNRLEEFTDRSHRTEGDHRNYSCRRKKMWSNHNCLVQGDHPLTEGKYSPRTRAVMRKWNKRTTQPAVIIAGKMCGFFRHKEMPWKSDTARVGWNSKDARSTKRIAYSHKTYVKPPKFDGKGCIESHLMQLKIAASRKSWTS